MDEIWKSIGVYRGIDYTGMYEVSNMGRVRSVDRYVNNNGSMSFRKGKILSTFVTCQYERVGLSKGKSQKHVSVHRLVAIAFVDNPYGYTEVNHIDENKLNNCADNLEWCTRAYNQQYYANLHSKHNKHEQKAPKRVIRPKKYCTICGTEISKDTKTGLCGTCYKRINPLRHKRPKCSICGKEVYSTSNHTGLCWDCLVKTKTSFYTLFSTGDYVKDRERLKNEIRAMPFATICKKYNANPTSVREWCDKMNLPRRKSEINSYTDDEWKMI